MPNNYRFNSETNLSNFTDDLDDLAIAYEVQGLDVFVLEEDDAVEDLAKDANGEPIP